MRQYDYKGLNEACCKIMFEFGNSEFKNLCMAAMWETKRSCGTEAGKGT